MSQNKIEHKGLTWELDTAVCGYKTKYRDILLDIGKTICKEWDGNIEVGTCDCCDVKDPYKTRKAAMEGAQVMARFMSKESVLSISKNMNIKPKEVENHIRRWL